MEVTETRVSLWEALAGRAPGRPTGPSDPDLWRAVLDRLNPAKAKPNLRDGIEEVELTSARSGPYIMLRSPDPQASYLRLTPEEVELAHLMDGTRTVAVLVGEFTRIAGRLAPDQVLRVVADLAGNRMLDELPLDAFRPLDRVRARHRPLPERIGRRMLASVRGNRMVLANIDGLAGFLYCAGGRLFFTRAAAVLIALVAIAGIALFVRTWTGGAQSVFLVGGSYATGALVLLGLNVTALACHELGHALAAKRAGRRVPAMGVLLYFGLPSVFVDTTDVWMAGRRARMLTSAAGPVAAMTLAGAVQLAAVFYPPLGPVAFKIAFVWYLNSLFNLNPLMALDGYYLFIDWLEIPNLRPRAIATVVSWIRRRRPRWSELDREGRLIAVYAVLASLWLVVMMNMMLRMYRERVRGLTLGLWHTGPVGRLLLFAIAVALASPIVYWLASVAGRTWHKLRVRYKERLRDADLPRRVDALRSTSLGKLGEEQLAALAADARWLRPRTGEQVLAAGATLADVLVVVDGALEGRRPGDPPGSIRGRAAVGELVGAASALTATPSALAWTTAGTRLLAVPARIFAAAVGPLVKTPPQADRAEAEALLEDAPALAGLSEQDRLGVLSGMRPVDLDPGRRVEVGPGQGAIVASGLLSLGGPDGGELRRGELLTPSGEEPVRAEARTPARVWAIPVLPGLSALASGMTSITSSFNTFPAPGTGAGPAAGVHPSGGYPPLSARPWAPLAGDPDRRLFRGLVVLLLLLALLALLTGRIAAGSGVAWAEMPTDRVLLSVPRGSVTASIGGHPVELHRGDRRFLTPTDRVEVERRSIGRLEFRGGGSAVLCPLTEVTVGPLGARGTRPVQPVGIVGLRRGALLADTYPETEAFSPLVLSVRTGRRQAVNEGEAVFGAAGYRAVDELGRLKAESLEVVVGRGRVFLDGRRQPATGRALACPALSRRSAVLRRRVISSASETGPAKQEPATPGSGSSAGTGPPSRTLPTRTAPGVDERPTPTDDPERRELPPDDDPERREATPDEEPERREATPDEEPERREATPDEEPPREDPREGARP